jgi:asparagine synthase (glutamine-hydrolysing)
MCGIVGIAGAVLSLDRACLPAMRDRLQHRGPDDVGLWWTPDGRVGFGHQRLAIVDLSPGGHQPMVTPSGDACVFNGEIYNYKGLREQLRAAGCDFHTDSDTEVLLHACRIWGPGALEHLEGMFAFAFYEASTERLLLARDRTGEKPLFYAIVNGRMMFASELKALLVHPDFPRRLNPEALNQYLTYGYIPGDRCILSGVSKLRPGHALLWEVPSASQRTWQYWRLPESVASSGVDDRSLEGELEARLEAAVRRQLVADVPVGVLLSGGVDSSLVTALAARVSSEPLRTFTVSFPGHKHHDESAFARLVATHFRTEHRELAADSASVSLLPALARQIDEPIGDSSVVPMFLVSREIRQHVTVALGGDGGDELFGGYPHYSWLLRTARVRRLMPALLRRGISQLAARHLPVGTARRNHLVGARGDDAWGIAHINVYFDLWARRQLLSPLIRQGVAIDDAPERERAGRSRPSDTLLRRATETDFLTTLPEAYLVKVDRMSMANSLEIRTPWLDRPVVEFAFGVVPDRLRATASARKILPRRLAARLLPAGLDLTRKQGLSMPLATWFQSDWAAFVTDVLRGTPESLFEPAAIERVLALQRRGWANEQRLFALVMFELWRREYQISL